MSAKEIDTIAKVLGHKDLWMSARYALVGAQYLSDAVKALDVVFDTVSGIPRPQSVPEPVGLIEGETVNA